MVGSGRFVRSPGQASVVPSIQTMPDTSRLYAAFGALDEGINSCCRCDRTGAIDYTPEPVEEEVVSRDEVDERRADAGGRTGELTVSLAWNTTDDLDLAVREPGGTIIYHKTGGRPRVVNWMLIAILEPSKTVPLRMYSGKFLLGRVHHCRFALRAACHLAGRPIDATVQIRKGNDVEVKSYSLNGENQDAVLTVNFSYP